MRVATCLSLGASLAFILSTILGGCDRLTRKDPAEAGKMRAEVKRQQGACASPSANDRIKNSIFDQAIAERNGDRANLDILGDYSVARMEDPVVQGSDPSLDITRCKGRFILEVPPGSERAFSGERQLQADIEYTAQASADGAGFVYQQKGAEPIIAKLAAFNLSPVAYRPPPAIDEPQDRSDVSKQYSVAEAQSPVRAQSKFPKHSTPVLAPRPVSSRLLPTPSSRGQVADRPSTWRRSAVPIPTRAKSGEVTVRAFYGALGAGNGTAASLQVIPEKRSGGAFSPKAMSRFYGRLPEPIRLTGVVPLAVDIYHVKYRYSAGRSRCKGSAIVKLTVEGGRSLIRSINSLSGC